MKRELYFENVAAIGNLYLEYVFLEFDKEPILFVCVNEKEQMYICLCSDIRGEQRWIISKSDICMLQDLVAGKIDLFSVFMLETDVILINRDFCGTEESSVVLSRNVDPLDLPKKGTLLKCNQQKAMSYLMSKSALFLQAISSRWSYMEGEKAKYSSIFEVNHSFDSDESEFLSISNAANKTPYQNKVEENDMSSMSSIYFFAA